MFKPAELYVRDRKEWCAEVLNKFPFIPWETICAKHKTTKTFYVEQCLRLNHLAGVPERDELTDDSLDVPPFYETVNEYYTNDAKRYYTREQFIARYGRLGPAIDASDSWERFVYRRLFARIDELKNGKGERTLLHLFNTNTYAETNSKSLPKQLSKAVGVCDVTGIKHHERQRKTGERNIGLGLNKAIADELDDGLSDGLEMAEIDDGL